MQNLSSSAVGRARHASVLITSAVSTLAFASVAFAEQPPASSGDFPSLPVVESRHGALNVTLTAAPKTETVAGFPIPGLVFNGSYAGPVMMMKPGERVRIHLVNHIDQPINLHFHGSHTTPQGHGDNVMIEVKPGTTFDYDFLVPKTQPPGLYWYHTHIHGQSEGEVARGLSGAMIVEGIERRVPEVAAARPRLMVLKTYTLDDPADPRAKGLNGVVQSVNGAAHSDLSAKAGGVEFWRISNQSPNDYYHLSAKGFRFRIVARDGAPTNWDEPVDKLDVAPAGRVEALVTMPAAGDYPLLSGATPTGSGKALKPYRELAMIHVSGPAPTSAPPTTAPVIARANGYRDLRSTPISTKRRLVFSQKPGEEVYMINGKTFDHTRVDFRVPLGSVEEWTIHNDTDDMHVFHIHQLHFQVVAINGKPQPFDGVDDVVRVPERGDVTVRIPFTDPQIVGRFMFHCHVLKHEDRGMMGMMEVYDPKRPNGGMDKPRGHDAMVM